MTVAGVLLWLFVLNLGVAFGAGLYEHRVVVSRWIRESPDGVSWDAEAARTDDTGRRFWGVVTTLPLTLLTLANLVLAWRADPAVRGWWLGAALAALADRGLTFGYFIPTMIGLMKAADSPAIAATAARWRRINYVRLVLLLGAWIAAMQALTVLQ
jgi:hypothetical protein